MYYTNVLDLAFTYNYNKARIAAHVFVSSTYPNATVVSKSISDFSIAANRTDQLLSFLVEGQCDLVVSVDPRSWQDVDIASVAALYPSVQFVENSAERLLRSFVSSPNYDAYTLDLDTPFFAAGYVAGKQAQTCVGAVYGQTPGTYVTSFYHGLVHAGSSASLIAINASTANSGILANLFGEAGCEVLVSFADEYLTYPSLVASMASKYPQLMSIGLGADASTIYGDSVLTSVYFDLTQLFINFSTQILQGGQLQIDGVVETKYLAELSPLAVDAQLALVFQDGLCGGLWKDTTGTVYTSCPSRLQRLDFNAIDNNIALRPPLTDPANCLAGSFTLYSSSDFSLTCPACGLGQYSATAGSASCTSCDPGLVTLRPGSVSCQTPSDSSKTWIIVVGVIVPLVGIALIAVLVWTLNRQPADLSRDSSIAPRGPVVVLGMLGVDQAQSNKKWRSSLSKMCNVYDKIYSIVSRSATAQGIYVFTSVGDIVMVSTATEHQMFMFFESVSAEAQQTNWGCDIKLKFAMHVGTPTVIFNEQVNAETARVAYTGPDVDLLRSLWKVEHPAALVTISSACGGGGAPNHPPAECSAVAQGAANEQTVSYRAVFAYGKWRSQSLPEDKPVDAGVPPPVKHNDEFSGARALSVKTEEEASSVQEEEEIEAQTETSNPLSAVASGGTASQGEMELDGLLDPPSLTKNQIEAIRGLCVDFIQKLLMVMKFEEQVTLVSHVASALHIAKPVISTTPFGKKSSNMLRPCTRLICQQLLATIGENEMLRWIAGLKSEIPESPAAAQ